MHTLLSSATARSRYEGLNKCKAADFKLIKDGCPNTKEKDCWAVFQKCYFALWLAPLGLDDIKDVSVICLKWCAELLMCTAESTMLLHY